MRLDALTLYKAGVPVGRFFAGPPAVDEGDFKSPLQQMPRNADAAHAAAKNQYASTRHVYSSRLI
ncbi:hypothetical protein AA23498_0764 [Acetobacter nitrogenifigens DSM 23921 = NBRC 105050]|nr:hypothetical protein AA23498_0764 [Acetobacter nitrogenifigens DSM 23921 = NBRC 105050]